MKNRATWDEYLHDFEQILSAENPVEPYDDPDFLEYAKLNQSRQKRWLKVGKVNEKIATTIKAIEAPQTWYLITEPWCGDASHNAPFIAMVSELNDKIELKIVRRDTEPSLIDDYLTDGGKAIPKLVIRDEQDNDLHVWGPRPSGAQKIHHELKAEDADFEKQKVVLQKWYNNDKGESIQKELLELLS